jgi:SAM-dependent methyltransferase
MIGTGWPDNAIDPEQPNLARVYDYLLGGAHNFAADRDLAGKLVAAVPDLPLIARAHRAFLHRAVRFCLNAGIRQFIDLGCGIPSVDNVHHITSRHADARVLYVDIDPVAATLNRLRHYDNDNVTAVQADLRHADEILDHSLLDLEQPAAVLMLSVLHLIPDEDDPRTIVAHYRDRVAAGSYLIVSHPTSEARPADIAVVDQLTRDAGPPPLYRSRDDIAHLLAGLYVAEPGLVWIPQWRPNGRGDLDDQPHRSGVLAAAGRKPPLRMTRRMARRVEPLAAGATIPARALGKG